MAQPVSMPVGIVVAREEIDSPWQDHLWRPVGVVAGVPELFQWKELMRGEGWIHYYATTLPLELHRKETEAYKHNLESRHPSLYIVLSEVDEDTDAEFPYHVHLVTASPFEAQDYLDSGEEIVEPVEMPKGVAGWISSFVDEHHVEQTFKKRRRDEVKIEEHKFGQEPIFETRHRTRQNGDG